jgi:DNA-binding GntR family transcriptional regulator
MGIVKRHNVVVSRRVAKVSRASDRAYAQIRAQIVSGTFAPGSPLREEQLAETCGVSRTPVREALRRLEAENFVERNAGQRSFVADWSLDSVEEAFTLRAMLEGHAAERAAARVTADQIATLRRHNAGIEAAIGRKDINVPVFLEENRAFHTVIMDAAHSTQLRTLLGGVVEQPVVLRTALHYDQAELMRSYREHEELIAAFVRRDSDWARAIMTAHIKRAFHAYSDAFTRARDS